MKGDLFSGLLSVEKDNKPNKGINVFDIGSKNKES